MAVGIRHVVSQVSSAPQKSSGPRTIASANLAIEQWRMSSGSSGAYAFAAFCVAVAGLLHWGLGLISEDDQHFTTFYPAVLFAALIGGAGAGTFAALLSVTIAWWAFMPPQFAFLPRTFGQMEGALIYLFASLLIVWGADHYRRLTKQLEDEERFRKLAVEELAHRLKNKVATIQSIVSYQLRDTPQTRRAIMGRLMALSATDDLVLEAQGKGARLRDILATELGPYESSRIAIDGPVMFLSPKLAVTMALLVHELATNSAKYGALSAPTGQIAICWSLSDARLNIEWRESGGPVITPPTHHGFGMQLLSRALDQFGGTVETTFEPTGLICKLTVPLPENSIAPDATSPDEGRELTSAFG
jgi:two-component sensor histidine kinase